MPYGNSIGEIGMNIQFKKGVVELCVMALLYKRDYYGYDLSEYLSSRLEISDGTVYPILRNLKDAGFVTTYLSEESGGPPRKYYSVTQTGKKEFLKNKEEWEAFTQIVKQILEEKDE